MKGKKINTTVKYNISSIVNTVTHTICENENVGSYSPLCMYTCNVYITGNDKNCTRGEGTLNISTV